MLSKATRLHVLIWLAYTPYLFDSPASVISSRSASSATRALNSAEWFLLFVSQIVFQVSRSTVTSAPKPCDHISQANYVRYSNTVTTKGYPPCAPF